MPNTDAVIQLVSSLLGRDMRAAGRTVESLGLQGVSPEELLQRLA
jgi:hypothetical protein